MFRQSPLPMWIYDLDTLRLLDVNRALEAEFGYSREEFLALSVYDMRPPSELPKLDALVELLRQEQPAPGFGHLGVWLYRTKDGRHIELEARNTVVHIGAHDARLVVARNVTETRRTEAALRESEARYRALARRLQTVREEERVELSRTIHDELGQSLTALKIDLSMLSKRVDPAMQERIEASAAAVDRMIQQVRSIATELRPGVLDHLGLVAAMEWQAKEFTRRSGISCEFYPPADEPVLTPDQSVSLFRVMQEALTNVVRHAQASNVWVSLESSGGTLRLTIADDGIGMSDAQRTDRASLGLIGMEERARSIDARLLFEKRSGRGTRVVIEMPLKAVEVQVQ